MTCSLCDGVALYQAGRRGFCKEHRAQAVEQATRDAGARVAEKMAEWLPPYPARSRGRKFRRTRSEA